MKDLQWLICPAGLSRAVKVYDAACHGLCIDDRRALRRNGHVDVQSLAVKAVLHVIPVDQKKRRRFPFR
jgi:hypothetical protein